MGAIDSARKVKGFAERDAIADPLQVIETNHGSNLATPFSSGGAKVARLNVKFTLRDLRKVQVAFLAGCHVGCQHQTIVGGNPGGCQCLVLAQFASQRFAIDPICHRAAIRAGRRELERGGEFRQQLTNGHIARDFGRAGTAGGKNHGNGYISHGEPPFVVFS
jgi:hypothetical protein